MWRRTTFLLCIALSTTAYGQNTGGVFGPVVNDGHRSVQYRIAFDTDTDNFAQRVHYQQALDGDRMWRVIAQTRKTSSSDFDFDYLQGELFWQLTDRQDYQSGVRFDLRVRDDSRPTTLGFNWMHQFQLSPQWSARALLLTSVDVGSNARDGIFLQSRGQINYRLPQQRSIGLELYSAYGSTDDFFSLDEQSHQLGPIMQGRIGAQWSWFGGALFGLTDGSADTQLRLWFTRSL